MQLDARLQKRLLMILKDSKVPYLAPTDWSIPDNLVFDDSVLWHIQLLEDQGLIESVFGPKIVISLNSQNVKVLDSTVRLTAAGLSATSQF